MLKKVLNYRSGLLNRLAAPISQYQKCKYSTENAENSASTKSEPPIQPLQLAYNSYEDLSSDPSTSPVIIMHGLFGSKQNWRSISKAIHAKTQPTRKVIAVDARNHGESPHSPHHRYVDLAEDVHLFYKEHNISKAIVVGHSMGGRAMMVFALKYPQLVEKAIIVDVSPVTTSPALKNMGEIFGAMRRVRVPNDIGLPEARSVADEQIKEFIPDKVTRNFILMNLYRAADGNFKWRSNVESLDDNFVKHIARFLGPQQQFPMNKYTAPILFIGGSKSDYLSYDWCVNIDGLEAHRSHLVSFPEDLKENYMDKPILIFGGKKSHLVKESQLPEIREYFPKVEMKFLDGGHNIGLSNGTREPFLDDVCSFIES